MDKTPKTQAAEAKPGKWDHIKVKSFFTATGAGNRVKRQLQDRRKHLQVVCLINIALSPGRCMPLRKQKTAGVGRDAEKSESSCTLCEIIKWRGHYGKLYGSASKKLKIEPLYDLVTPLLGIHPKESKGQSQRNICTPMFITALFTTFKKWKQHNVHRWVNGDAKGECPTVGDSMDEPWGF